MKSLEKHMSDKLRNIFETQKKHFIKEIDDIIIQGDLFPRGDGNNNVAAVVWEKIKWRLKNEKS